VPLRLYHTSSDDAIILMLILVLAVMAVVFNRSRPLVNFNLRNFFKQKRRYSVKGVITKNYRITAVILIFFELFIISISVFDYITSRCRLTISSDIPYWLLPATMAVLSLFSYLKFQAYRLSNWTFFNREQSDSWTDSYLFITSLIVFPLYAILMLELYSGISFTYVVFLYLFLAVLYEISLIFKLFVNFKVKYYGTILFFSYLCGVEIVPGIIIWKLVAWASDIYIAENVLY